MKNSILILIALVTVPLATIVAPQVPAQALSCGVGKTPIGVRFPKNPDSYNDFTFTQGKVFCVNNSTINGTSSTSTPSNYKKARYALKLLTSVTTPIGTPNLFRPFNFNATNVCTATQNSLGIKFALTPALNNPSNVTVKFCRGLVSGGIGDDARMKESIRQTLYYYYFPTLSPTNINVLRSNGTSL